LSRHKVQLRAGSRHAFAAVGTAIRIPLDGILARLD
jgi:hypothetical protein